ncbi:hypothetical protein [Micromonospora sp. NPDC007230]|uniref:hypothetical protein n=1 Tax=Micromonospora sp. NPDC007230 TaxID=3364237 RepID=UPI0036777CDD
MTARRVASLAANVMAAEHDAASCVVSAWPAVALLLTVEVLARAGRAPATVAPAADVSPAAVADTGADAQAVAPPPAPAPSLVGSTVADTGRADDGRPPT